MCIYDISVGRSVGWSAEAAQPHQPRAHPRSPLDKCTTNVRPRTRIDPMKASSYVCPYMYTCIYIYIHIYIYISIHIYICRCICIYILHDIIGCNIYMMYT